MLPQVQGCCCGARALQPPLREPLVSLLDFEQKCHKWCALLADPVENIQLTVDLT